MWKQQRTKNIAAHMIAHNLIALNFLFDLSVELETELVSA